MTGRLDTANNNQMEPKDLMYILPNEEQIALILWYRRGV